MTEVVGSRQMSALVVYESMYGNTSSIARAIAEGIENTMPVTVVNVNHASASSLLAIDLLVVGAPTHVHGLSGLNSRAAAICSASDALPLDVEAIGTGVREWLTGIETSARYFAAFDTRINMPRWITGAATPLISRLLRARGLEAITTPEGFLVTDETRLVSTEFARAKQWGRELAHTTSVRLSSPVDVGKPTLPRIDAMSIMDPPPFSAARCRA